MESSFYLDVTAIITALLAILKSLNSDRKTKNVETETKVIRLERVESKKTYDEKFAEQSVQIRNIERRLDSGDARFGALERKIDDNFRDLKNDFLRFGSKVNYTMGLIKGQEIGKKKKE